MQCKKDIIRSTGEIESILKLVLSPVDGKYGRMEVIITGPSVAVRNQQMQQFNAFIDLQNIPADEAVIFGGDMNVDKFTNKLNEYNNMFSIFNASEPDYIGHSYSWDKYSNHYIDGASDDPEYLDYVLADNDYLIPDEQSNSVWVLRSNHDDMWDIHDLSDHFGIHGRFVYCPVVAAAVSAGWNMISTNVDPKQPDMMDVIQGHEDDIIIIKNGDGDVVVPSFGINQIGDWDVADGYQIKASNPFTLEMKCSQVDPDNTPISLSAGWSLISYLRKDAMDASIALAEILSDIVIVKNGDGQVYFPSFGLNNIGDMNPGDGYKIKMLNVATLTYPANTARTVESSNTVVLEASYFRVDVKSGDNATVMIPEGSIRDLRPGDEIGVFNNDMVLCGSGVYSGNHLAITIWGDDEASGNARHMLEGEAYVWKVWRLSDEQEFDLQVSYRTGESYYRADGISIVGEGTVKDQHLDISMTELKVYPNPVSELLMLDFRSGRSVTVRCQIVDITGRQIRPDERFNLDRGSSSIKIDVTNLPAGQYFYKIDGPDQRFNGSFIKL